MVIIPAVSLLNSGLNCGGGGGGDRSMVPLFVVVVVVSLEFKVFVVGELVAVMCGWSLEVIEMGMAHICCMSGGDGGCIFDD
mgnify:CR=1 FL=1